MNKYQDKTNICNESDATLSASDSRPILMQGIGRRISDACELLGSRTSAYSVMGVSSAALQRYIKESNMPPFDVAARLCLAAGVRMEWLATGEGDRHGEASPSQSVGLDAGTLAQAVGLLQGLLVGRGTLSPGDYAAALIGLYQVCAPDQPREALTSKVVEISAFVAHRAQGA